jgi:hypothetical protein
MPLTASMTLWTQLLTLVILAVPIACISWTVTHEEIVREPREWCARRSAAATHVVPRKFFYILTCEYCFSHYVTIVVLACTRFTMLYDGWRGYVVSAFSLVWVANVYMSLFVRLRLDIKHEGVEIAVEQAQVAASRVDGDIDRRSRPGSSPT